LSDAYSTYGIGCIAVKAGIAQSVKSLGYVPDNWRKEIRIAGHSRTPVSVQRLQTGCCAHPKSTPAVSVLSLPCELISKGMKVKTFTRN
jgi:hypothetical protein